MPFRYKLQKVLDFRIRKKEEQEAVVSRARQKLREAEQRIEENKQEILQVSTAKRTADYSLMEYYDKYLHHLWDKAETLEQERQVADDELQIEIKKLIECEQNVKVLEKHKEKNREAYIAEEKAAELKQYSELGVTRYFRQSQERAEEEEQILKQLEQIDGGSKK